MSYAKLNYRSVRPGMASAFGILCVVTMLAMASMSVDVGVFYLAKCEIERAADSAALAGAAVLHDGGTDSDAVIAATSFAKTNSISGTPLSNNCITVEVGSYHDHAFYHGETPSDAVRVLIERSAVKQAPVRLYFSGLFGVTNVDVRATAIARTQPVSPFNLVGIDHASFGSIGVAAQVNGRFVSNGDVKIGYPLGLFVKVHGDARSWTKAPSVGALATVDGSKSLLTDQLVYPSVQIPAGNDNGSLGSNLDGLGNFVAVIATHIPGGTYVVNDLNLLAGVAIVLDGPVTFYVKGDFNFAACPNILGNMSSSASNLKIRVLPGGRVNFLAPLLGTVNMDLYAPDSNVIVGVPVSNYAGRMIGKTLDILVPAICSITEDQTLGSPTTFGKAITLVQ